MYMYFSITGVKKIISCIKDFVIEVCYYQGSTVSRKQKYQV